MLGGVCVEGPPRLSRARAVMEGMVTMEVDPRQLFDMRLAHVGVNAKDPAEAAQIAAQFSELLHLTTSVTPVSHFVDTMVEVMDGGGRGEHGHIGFAVNDLRVAAAWFDANGYEVDYDSMRYDEGGNPRLVYFKEPIAGFAIHLCQA